MSALRCLAAALPLLAGCAHLAHVAPVGERIYDEPLEVAMAAAAELLHAKGIEVHPVEGQPHTLVSDINEWDSANVATRPSWARDHISVKQRSRWVVTGRALDAKRSAVQIARVVDNSVTNRSVAGDLPEHGSKISPLEARIDGTPVRFEPFEQELAAKLDALVAVETLSPDEGPIAEPDAPLPRSEVDAGIADRDRGDCSIQSEAIDDFIAPGNTLLLGDQLGNAQSPAAFGALTCSVLAKGLEVIVALAVPAVEQASLNAFLKSDGGPGARAALVRGPFWESPYPDGSSSMAMAELLDRLRRWKRRGAPLTVLAIDAGVPGNPREAAMAARIERQQQLRPSAFTLVLTGNVHVSRNVGAPWDPGLLPLGHRLGALDAAGVLALDLSFQAGSRWACRLRDGGRLDCAVFAIRPGLFDTDMLPPNITLVRRFSATNEYGYDGTWYVGKLTPSMPAVQSSVANPGAFDQVPEAPPPRPH